MIQDIVCDSINMQAVLAYQTKSAKSYVTALQCLVDRCGLSSSVMLASASEKQPTTGRNAFVWIGTVMITLACVAFILQFRRNRKVNLKEVGSQFAKPDLKNTIT
jgi:hypothetical protein